MTVAARCGLFPILLIFLVCGVNAAESKTNSDEEDLSVEEILTREPALEDYGAQERCISTHRMRGTEVLDDRHVAIKVSKDEYYLVRFKHRCPGLNRHDPVIFERNSSSRLCEFDSIRPTYDYGAGGMTPGGPCSIPGFEGITKEQLVVLKDTLQAQKRQQRDARRAARQRAKELKQQQAEG